jgi:hypothetical protein
MALARLLVISASAYCGYYPHPHPRGYYPLFAYEVIGVLGLEVRTFSSTPVIPIPSQIAKEKIIKTNKKCIAPKKMKN